MWLTPIHKTNSIVSDEIWAVNIAWRAVNTVTNTVGAVINRTSNAISKLFSWAGKVLKNGLVAWWLAAAAITFPVSAPAIYGALATGKLIKNKAEGKGRWESLGNAITRPLWADTVAKYTDFGKVGEGIKDMTIWAGSEIAKWAGELITVPLIGAKFDDTHSSTGSPSDENSISPHNPSTTSTEHTTTEQSSSKSSTSKAEHHTDTVAAASWWAVAWAAATHAIDSTKAEKEAKKAAEKAERESKEAEKKAEADKKKEEEKTAKEDIAKTVDELNKQQKTFASKIDTAVKKVEELTSAEKMRDKIDQYDKQIKIVQEDIIDKIDIEKRKNLTTPRWIITLDTIWTLPDDRPLDPTTSWSIDEKDQYDFIKNLVNSIVPIIENGISREETENLPTTKVKKDRYSSNREEGFEELIRIKKKVNKTPMEALKKEDIRNLKLYIWSDQNDEWIIERSFSGDIKTINQNKKNSIDAKPEHIEKQQNKLVEALNKMKTDSGKAVSSIASSSRLWGKKLNKDNASDALEQLADAMNIVTEQASAGEKRIDMTKPIAGISDSYQSLLSSIQSLTS